MEKTEIPGINWIKEIPIGFRHREIAQVLVFKRPAVVLKKRLEFIFFIDLVGKFEECLRKSQSPLFAS